MKKTLFMLLLLLPLFTLSGCGSFISRAYPGQAKGQQFYPGVRWDLRSKNFRAMALMDLPLSLLVDTLLLPVDFAHGPYR
jgi:uncharacterized protein YceK